MEEKLDYGRVVPIFFLVFVDVLGLTIILPLLHLYAAAYGASPLEIGLVAAAFPLAQLIGVPVMGALSDRFGRKPLLLISQITTCISFIMLGLADSLLIVVLSRVLDGTFGANIATAQAALSDVTTEKTRTQGLGLTGAAFGLGFIFGPIIAIAALEFTDDLGVPALIAAGYSLLSILITLFMFKETLPPEKRGDATGRKSASPFIMMQMMRRPGINVLLVLMFAQQFVFFGFEALLGLFTLNRLGLLGQGNSLVFLVVGFVLVIVQVRFIGKWSQKYGEAKMVTASLGLIALGLVMIAFTPEQAHPFYVERIARNELLDQRQSGTEAILGEIAVDLPPDSSRGFGGVIWLLIFVIPLSVGSGLIRPSLNSLMTKRVSQDEYGSILGTSSAFVSAANAAAPLVGALIFQEYGSTAPFLLGGVIMFGLALMSAVVVRPVQDEPVAVASA